MTDQPDVAALLRAHSRGFLPAMAATEFLIATGMVGRAVWLGLVKVEKDAGGPYTAHLSDGADWDAVANLSGGEYATLKLAESMAHGELSEWFWRMDPTRKQAFTDALIATIGA